MAKKTESAVKPPAEVRQVDSKFGWCSQGRECDFCRPVTSDGLRCGCTCHRGETLTGPRKEKPANWGLRVLQLGDENSPEEPTSTEQENDKAAA